MRKIIYVAVLFFSLFFASCSINRNNVNTAYLQSGRLQTGQQLTVQHANHQGIAAIDAPGYHSNIPSESINLPGNHAKVEVRGPERRLKSLAGSNRLRKAGKNFTEITKLPKAMATVCRTMKMPTRAASAKNLPFEGANYLLLWIIFLAAAVLFFILVNVAGAITILGLLFNILGILALLGFLLFLILWTVQLYQAKQK